MQAANDGATTVCSLHYGRKFTTVMQALYGRLQPAYDGMQAVNDGATTVCSLHYGRKCSLRAGCMHP